jgi:hypothetical protein
VQQRCTRVRITRQEQDRIRRQIGVVDAGRGDRQAGSGADNPGLAPPSYGAPGLQCDHFGTPRGRFESAFALLMILEVTTTMSSSAAVRRIGIDGRENDLSKISAGRHLTDPSWGEDRDHEVADLIA